MNNLVMIFSALCVVEASQAQTTLRCQLPDRCDAEVTNCTRDPLTLVITVDTARGTVSVNNRLVEASYTNPAKVSFPHQGHTVDINRYDSNIVMYAPGVVRMGACSRTGLPW